MHEPPSNTLFLLGLALLNLEQSLKLACEYGGAREHNEGGREEDEGSAHGEVLQQG